MVGWAAQYIGIPFVVGGRDRAGADCYGLVRLIQFEQFSRQLPSFSDEYDSIVDRKLIAELVDVSKPLIRAEQIEQLQPGDVVLLRYMGFPMHLGVYVGDNMIIHTLHGTNTVVQQLDDAKIKGRIEGFYRIG